jgi:TatA/E family protein of Tat protein translocase
VFNVGPLELIVVLIIALIVLGPQRLPDVARSLGRGMREFRSALDSAGDDEHDDMDHDDEADATDQKADPEVEKADAEPPAGAATTPAPPSEGDYQKEAESSEPSSSSKGLV